MYETEIYLNSIAEELPPEVWKEFVATQESVVKKSILHWSEHCTECAMPDCFKTCGLYAPRVDGKCQRFVNGIEKLRSNKSGEDVQILKIQFKKWGVLATQGNNKLYSLKDVQQKNKRDILLARLIHLAQPTYIRKKLSQKRYSIKKNYVLKEQNTGTDIPDAFLVEIFNPSNNVLSISVTVRNENEKDSKLPFQYRMELNPGYNKEVIPFKEIERAIKTTLPYRIDLTPNTISSQIPLYFGLMDFVRFKKEAVSNEKAKKIKCIVWDLDNTIWNGVLVEDGLDKITLKEEIVEILSRIEEKGVINSIASKNNPEVVFNALEHFNLKDYFLHPKISWQPKSKSIQEIAFDLNINVNTFLFIDDSEFERKEVETVLPQIKLIDAIYYREILDLEELQIPVTEETKKRKRFYMNEVKRKEVSDSFEGQYFEFLKSCEIELEIGSMEKEHFDRVYELTQRTNQMNFSGNRYVKEDILKIYNDEDLNAYILKCRDRFGDYGIVGFCLIKKSENRLIDLMFSCRIQSKRVEHAFLTYILEKYLQNGDFWVTYNHTEKNRFSSQVFKDFEFTVVRQSGSERELKFDQGNKVPNDKIISIIS